MIRKEREGEAEKVEELVCYASPFLLQPYHGLKLRDNSWTPKLCSSPFTLSSWGHLIFISCLYISKTVFVFPCTFCQPPDPSICLSSLFWTPLLSQPISSSFLFQLFYTLWTLWMELTQSKLEILFLLLFLSFLLCLPYDESFLMLILFPSAHLSLPFVSTYSLLSRLFCHFFLFIWREFKAPRVSKRGLELRLGVGRFVSLVLIVINYGVLLIRARRGSLWRQHLLPVLTLTNNGNTRHHVNGRHLGLS